LFFLFAATYRDAFSLVKLAFGVFWILVF